jgi:threonine/homoserine/homoserine lactone efflux protein
VLYLALALLRGVALGIAAAVPFGPVNAAVVDTAMRRTYRLAMSVGLGGAVVDFVYSQLAVMGIGGVLSRYPNLSTALIGGSGVILVIFGIKTLLAPPLASEDAVPERPVDGAQGRPHLAAFMSGVLLTLANPAALISWVVLAGAWLGDLSRLGALFAGVGIFLGCTLWFLGIAHLARRGKVKFGERARWLTKGIGALIVVYGIILVGQAGLAFAAHLK